MREMTITITIDVSEWDFEDEHPEYVAQGIKQDTERMFAKLIGVSPKEITRVQVSVTKP